MTSSSEQMVLPSSEIQLEIPLPSSPRRSLPSGGTAAKKKNKKKMMKKKKGGRKSSMSEHRSWLEKQKDSLMIVAALFAEMTYQAGLSPPGGVWEDRHFDGVQYHDAGTSVLGVNNITAYTKLYTTNTVAFIASLSIILLLTSGLPFIGRGLFLWILTAVMWAAITSIALTYAISVATFTPINFHGSDTISAVVGYSIVSWCGLMLLLLITHTVLLVIGNRREKALLFGKEDDDDDEED